MNVAVLVWWFWGTPMKWYLKHFKIANEKRLLQWIDRRRQPLQRVLFMSADTQTVTGIALTTAALFQFWNLPIYHIAVILDLLGISANSQAVMLLYGMNQTRAMGRSVKRRWHSLLNPRLPISVAYVLMYYTLAGLAYTRFNDIDPGRDCLLNYPPQFGNYGKWSLAEATLTLAIYIVAYGQDLAPELQCQLDERFQRLLGWLYESFLPLFTITYFIWSSSDLVTLKIANRAILNDNTEENISAFGQVIPIVLLLLLLLSLWDLCTSEGDEGIDGQDSA
jgi:hypothetical protein